jgi:glycosyltransferase involved in cell wall biosynthesis
MDWALTRAGRLRAAGDRVFHLAYDGSMLRRHLDAPVDTWLRSLGIAPSAIVCWFAGTLGRTYNINTAVSAARILHQNGDRRFHFVFSGKGDQEETLRRTAVDLPNVTFTGWIDEPKLAALMRTAVVGLAAYDKAAPQGLPNKIGEYSCGGLAIVSSLRGEAERLLARYHAGVHYDADDPQALVACLQRIGNDPELLARLRRNSTRLFEEEFDAEKVYRRMADYLTTCAPACLS